MTPTTAKRYSIIVKRVKARPALTVRLLLVGPPSGTKGTVRGIQSTIVVSLN